MMGYVKNFLRPFDMFGYNNFLFYKSKKKFKTSLFGFISLMFILVIISKFIQNVFILFHYERETNNVVYYKLKDQEESSIKPNKLPMIFQVEVKDAIQKRKVDFASIFGNEIYVRYNRNQNKTDVTLKKYNMSDFILPMKDLEMHQNILENYDYKFFRKDNKSMIDYYECNSLFLVNLTKININENFAGTLSFIFLKSNEESYNIDQIYMQFNFITVDTKIENIKKKDGFYSENLKSHYLTTKIRNGININLKKTLIKSYTNKLMYSKSHEEFEIIRYEFEKAIDVNNFFEINISLHDKIEIYERNYFNLVSLMTECGGLLSTFKSLIFVIHLFYEYYFIRNLKNLIFLDDKTLDKTIPKNFKRISQKLFFKENKSSVFDSLFNKENNKSKNLKQEKFSINNENNSCEKFKFEYFDDSKSDVVDGKVISMSYISPRSDRNISCVDVEKNFETEKPLIKKKKTSILKVFKKNIISEFTYSKKNLMSLKECIKELLDVRRYLLLQIRYNEFFNFLLDTFKKKNSNSKNSIDSYVSIESILDDSIKR